MADIKFTRKSIEKLMEILDNYKDNNSNLDDITYLEMSNAVKTLFDRIKVNNDIETSSVSSLDSFTDSELSINSGSTLSDSRSRTRRGTVVGNVRWG
jgi:hypothetical protein